jgi:hypothetical protein
MTIPSNIRMKLRFMDITLLFLVNIHVPYHSVGYAGLIFSGWGMESPLCSSYILPLFV